MSVHPSLSSKSKGKRIRSVLKRFERLEQLREKEKWKTGNSVFGLPKVKTLRWKLKKAKKTVEAEAGAVEGAAQEQAPSAKPQAKEPKSK